MSRPPLFSDGRTPEQKAVDHQQWVDKHWLEPGRGYKFEVNRIWEGTGSFGRIYRWSVVIRETESPWSVVCVDSGHRTKFGAQRWARHYLRRGGPPEGYFQPLTDPNRVVFRPQSDGLSE